QTFFMDQDVQDAARLDAVVTVADAMWLKDRLKDAPEAKNQIAFADVILLNKTDLVSPEQLREVEARIRAINPYAKLHKTVKSNVDIKEVLGRNAFDLDRILEIEPAFLTADDGHDHARDHQHDHDHSGPDCDHPSHKHDHGHSHGGLKHYHDEDMQSVACEIAGDVDPEKFMPWINDLVQTDGANILRSKGILAFKGEPKRFVFQGVHMVLDGDLQRDWKADEKRTSKIVFIGRELKKDAIETGFRACAA
ncbi:MAG: GTP-binding protein, partial [Beijerinckiaceae bacterium]